MVEFVSLRTCALLTLLAFAAPAMSPLSAAAAVNAEDAAAAEAKRHYEEGTKAFNLGEFGRAIAEFKATYNVKPDPLLLYNIAQSYRLAGDANQALFFYKSFLRNMPAATNRKEVEAQIRKLEKQIEDQKQAPPPAAIGAGAPPAVIPPPVNAPPPEPAAPTPLATPPRTAPASVPPPRAAVDTTPPPRATTPSFVPAAPAPAPPAAQVDMTASPPRTDDQDAPIYKKWWFWAGAAGAVLIIGGIAAANAKKGPNTTLGTYDPEFK